jgi:septum formation topological specificity factor MinE
MSRKTKKSSAVAKPRNRLVVAARFRKAGAHGKSYKALRREQTVKTAQESALIPPE